MMAAAFNVQVVPVIVIDCEMRCFGVEQADSGSRGRKA